MNPSSAISSVIRSLVFAFKTGLGKRERGASLQLGVLAASLLLLMSTAPAFGHARFIESDPMPDAVVTAAPEWVTIYFGEILEHQGNSIKVLAADGTQVDLGDVNLLDGNHRAIWVSLQPGLSAGTYQVAWSNVSAEDGHGASGEFAFTVAPSGDSEQTVAAGPCETEAG
jgi:methionine-rich copper-binding protein CopC